MSPKRSAFALSLAAGALMLGMTPSSAGGPDGFGVGISIEVHGHGHQPRPWRLVGPPLRPTGPQLYYAYHPDHIPGYPVYDHLPGYPVPIFPSYHTRLVAQPAARAVFSPHFEWCHARYRSYRAHDNSFQPYRGGRRQCWSPYG